MQDLTLLGMSKLRVARLVTLVGFAILIGVRGAAADVRADTAVRDESPALAAALRRNTQLLLDAIAPGNVAVWDRLLDPSALQIDENDVVRSKPEILRELKPLGPGLVGHIDIADFRIAVSGDVAVVTHEDAETLDYHGQMIRSRFRITDTWRRTPHGWRVLGSQVLAVLQDPPAVALDETTLCSYAGRYTLTPTIVVMIHCSGDQLLVEREGQPERKFQAELKDVFFEPGRPRVRRIFIRDGQGRISAFVDRREGSDVRWIREPGSAG